MARTLLALPATRVPSAACGGLLAGINVAQNQRKRFCPDNTYLRQVLLCMAFLCGWRLWQLFCQISKAACFSTGRQEAGCSNVLLAMLAQHALPVPVFLFLHNAPPTTLLALLSKKRKILYDRHDVAVMWKCSVA